MKYRKTYENIDMERTGIRMKNMLSNAGYTPNMIKDFLHLSCVQPIYRWYKGRILPSVDHLLMLSELLGVHMEELLVKKEIVSPLLEKDVHIYDIEVYNLREMYKRFVLYKNMHKQLIA